MGYIRKKRPPGIEHNNIETLMEDIWDFLVREGTFLVDEFDLVLTVIILVGSEYLAVFIILANIMELRRIKLSLVYLEGHPPKPIKYIKVKSLKKSQRVCSRKFKMKLLGLI